MNMASSDSQKLIVVASMNKGKIDEFNHYLESLPLKLLPQPEGIVITENGKTFSENARIKALQVSNLTGQWAIADDSGLCVDALKGAPGIFSARYASNDKDRVSRLLKELDSCSNRSAYFSSAICIAAPENKILLEVEAQCKGLISQSSRGKNGFGYDPIFEVIGTGLTFAEMESKQKRIVSHRGKAFKLLEPSLKELLKNNK